MRAHATPAGLFAAVVVLIVAACGSPTTTPAPSVAPSAQPSVSDSAPATSSDAPTAAPIPESPVAGIVDSVDSAGLDQVKGFTLRTNDGETIKFTIGTLENGDEFPPGHLKEHQATAAPILVFFKQVNADLVVYRIEDAG